MREWINLVESAQTEETPVDTLDERAPHTKKGEKFIKKHKAEFKKRYGDMWKQILYATAWKLFGE
jgi:hypothetical protein